MENLIYFLELTTSCADVHWFSPAAISGIPSVIVICNNKNLTCDWIKSRTKPCILIFSSTFPKGGVTQYKRPRRPSLGGFWDVDATWNIITYSRLAFATRNPFSHITNLVKSICDIQKFGYIYFNVCTLIEQFNCYIRQPIG